MLGEILDPNPYNATYSQETMNLCESIAVRLIQDLLDLLILWVIFLHKCSKWPTATTSGMQMSIFHPEKVPPAFLTCWRTQLHHSDAPKRTDGSQCSLNDLVVLIIQANVLTIQAEVLLV